MFVDSHCHLDRLDLKPFDQSLDKALDTARSRGVSGFLCVDIDLDNFEAVKDIAESHADVWCSAGVHPTADDHGPLDGEILKQLARSSDRVVAIGECGLDYFRGDETRELQLQRLDTQLAVALELDLPVIIHTRDAREDTLDRLRPFADKGGRGVLHCFTESLEMARAAIDFGFYISFSGIVTFKNAAELQAVALALPLANILIETDSPYLAPVPHRGRSNHPAWVVDVAHFLADLKGVSADELAEATTRNFYDLFSRATPGSIGMSSAGAVS